MRTAARTNFQPSIFQTDPYAAAVVNEISIATLDSAAAALAVIKEGVSQVSIDRAKVGRRKLALKSRASG